MKKYLFFIPFLLILPSWAFADNVSFAPISITPTTSFTVACDITGTNQIYLIGTGEPGDELVLTSNTDCQPTPTGYSGNIIGDLFSSTSGTIHGLVIDSSTTDGSCGASGTVAACLADPGFVADLGDLSTFESASASSSTCETVFGSTTGCSYQVVDNPTQDYFYGILLFLLVTGWIANYFSRQIHG